MPSSQFGIGRPITVAISSMSIIPFHTVFGLALAGASWPGRCNQRRR